MVLSVALSYSARIQVRVSFSVVLHGARKRTLLPASYRGTFLSVSAASRFSEHGNKRKSHQKAGACVILALSENAPSSEVILGTPFRRPDFELIPMKEGAEKPRKKAPEKPQKKGRKRGETCVNNSGSLLASLVTDVNQWLTE